MRTTNYTSVRIAGDLVERIKAILPSLGRGASVNSFVEDACDGILGMIDQKPDKRTCPALVLRIDAVSDQNTARFNQPISSTPPGSQKPNEVLGAVLDASIAKEFLPKPPIAKPTFEDAKPKHGVRTEKGDQLLPPTPNP